MGRIMQAVAVVGVIVSVILFGASVSGILGTIRWKDLVQEAGMFSFLSCFFLCTVIFALGEIIRRLPKKP